MGPTMPNNRAKGCPSREELAAFNRGEVEEDRLEALAAHLSACGRCVDVLGALPDAESVLANLRRSAEGDTVVEDPGCRELEVRARAIRVPGASEATVTDGPCGVAAEQLRLPRAFGQYTLLERVGRGGMGVVYRARQLTLKREVALKLIRAGAAATPEELARFRVEGEALARLRHPGVILIHDLGEHDGELYLAAEYVEGGSLADKLKDGPLQERQAAELVRRVALAVQAAHEAQVIHRDLKPANVLLAADGTPKVSDFGLAKLLDTDSGQTASETVLGTPDYMAPEQAKGHIKDIDARTDVWALGVILYECLTGRPPFKGQTRGETLEQVRTREPVRPARCKPGLAADLEAVCLKCLEKRPAHRYSSAQELAEDLERFLAGEPTRARPVGRVRRFWKGMRRHPWRSLAAAVVVAALVLTPAALFFFDPDRPLRDIETRLARGETVTLIGDTGEPKWSYWLSGGRAARTMQAAEGAFAIHTTSVSLLELVRNTRQSHYRVRAQVRHDGTVTAGAVGLFFCAHRPCSPRGGLSFLQLTFNDITGAQPPLERLSPEARRLVLQSLKRRPPNQPFLNRVLLVPCLHEERASAIPWHLQLGGPSPEMFQPAGLAEKPWRHLTIEVTPQGVRGFWGEERKLVGWMTFGEVLRQANLDLSRRRRFFPSEVAAKDFQPEWNPSGSLGLFVNNGTASFRRVVIESLGKDD